MTPQHMNALKQANAIRAARYELHREIRSLPVDESWGLLADVVENPPACVARQALVELLQWGKRVGPSQAERWMKACGVGLTRTVEQTSPRKLGLLAECLRGHEDDVRETEELRDFATRHGGKAA